MKRSIASFALLLLPLFLLSCGSDTPSNPQLSQLDACLATAGVILPGDFTASGYIARNPDLADPLCGGECSSNDHCLALANHYATAGVNEGRPYKEAEIPTSSSSSGGERVNRIGFLPFYAKTKAEDIDYSRFTQLNYFSATLNADGSLSTSQMEGSPIATDVIPAARAAGLPIWYTIGGANRSQNMKGVFGDPALRAAFVNNAVAYAQQKNYQGIDIDWEFPKDDADASAQTAMLCELYAAANPLGIGVSVDAPTHHHTDVHKTAVTHADFAQCVDQINVMSYDYNILIKRQNDPANEVIATMDYWLEKGLPANKLNMGITFYGSDCTDPTVKCESMTWDEYYYRTINDMVGAGMNKLWIGETDDRNTKADYIKNKNLAGVLYWEITQDVPFSDKSFPHPKSQIVRDRIAAWWDNALTARGM